MIETKPFVISQTVVREAYRRVKASNGAAGVDGESIAEFERDVENNLYKIWNRMSSGTYFPPPVRSVDIPKENGKGIRKLGVPTVGDRVAQMVVKLYLEPEVETKFHPHSYGYRPGKSALDAVETAWQRCRKFDWIIDLDIQGFFDNLDWQLVLRAVRKHTDCKWIILYIERWLKAPIQLEDGTLVARDCGSPQGSVISPLISNIFMHHAFDVWMSEKFSHIPFERYADDVLAHCATEKQAVYIRDEIAKRLKLCKLELHPEKTCIVYCKDDRRKSHYKHERLDFLGYTFRPRSMRTRRGELFVSFSPAISDKAAKAIRGEIKRWKLHLHTSATLNDLAQFCNAQVRGWINYYGRFYRSALYPVLRQIDFYLARWAERKYKRYANKSRRAWLWLRQQLRRTPKLFAHWQLGRIPKSRVTGAV